MRKQLKNVDNCICSYLNKIIYFELQSVMKVNIINILLGSEKEAESFILMNARTIFNGH